MHAIKKYLGIVWMIIGIAAILVLIYSAFQNIDPAGTREINKPIPWLIIIAIFTPIATGLVIFGWYALKGEFED
jgi:purine-cytosine permease-like protein